MLKMIINKGEFSCEIESFSEGLNRKEQDNQTFSKSLILYELTVNIKTPDVQTEDFSSFLRYNSITSIDIYLEENEESTEIFSSEKFTEVFNISRLVNKYYPSDALITIYFRNVQGTAR